MSALDYSPEEEAIYDFVGEINLIRIRLSSRIIFVAPQLEKPLMAARILNIREQNTSDQLFRHSYWIQRSYEQRENVFLETSSTLN